MDDEQRRHLEELRRGHQRRLHQLERQQATFGVSTAPEISIEIEDIRTAIARIDTDLKRYIPTVTVVIEPGLASGRPEAISKLELAIRDAPSGAILRLSPGIYDLGNRPLVIDKPLTLVGAGMDETLLIGTGERYVAYFSGTGPFIVATLSFEHQGQQWAHVVEITGGVIDVQQCRFVGGVLDKKRGGSGLCLSGETTGVVIGCEAIRNMLSGIQVQEQAQPTLGANICHKNQTCGIFYRGSASGIARQNTCTGNGSGIAVVEQAQPMIGANTCCENTYSGIEYFNSACGVARQNTCTGNGTAGINVQGQAQPMLEANICTGNAYNGILVQGQAQPTLEANACHKNTYSGIRYIDSAGGVVRSNQCSSNGVSGIYIASTACPTIILDNRCQGNSGEEIDDQRKG